MHRWRFWLTWSAVALLVVAGLAGALAGWHWRRGGPPAEAEPDPRVTYPTPYRNVRPEVAYVGDEACAPCHAEVSRTYHEHPMGRSMAVVSAAAGPERSGAEAHSPFTMSGQTFRVERRDGQVFHEEEVTGAGGRVLATLEAEARFAIGSGRRGKSYLVERDGYLRESPISWYSQAGRWDLSPGFTASTHFNWPVPSDCLFCHANHAEPVEQTVNRYRAPVLRDPAIGCERCHGPGALHVAARQGGDAAPGADDTIVNPARLEPELRESVCQQCHLQGDIRVLPRGRQTFDFRPGLPLRLFWSVFARPQQGGDKQKSVTQVEQMRASGCYRGSSGRLGCISCHDPHVLPPPAEAARYYRNRCLRCHQEGSCSVPVARRRREQPDDSCVACHMPRIATSNIAHTALTDHRIPRSPQDAANLPAARPGPRLGEAPLVYFFQDRDAAVGPEVARDTGLALAELARLGSAKEVRLEFGRSALSLLRPAVRAHPDDVPAREAESYALWLCGVPEDALAAYEALLAQEPERERALADAARLAAQLGRRDAAVEFGRRAVRVNPYNPEYHALLARALTESGRAAEAADEARAAIRLDPTDVATRQALITAAVRGGDPDLARREFDDLLALRPPDSDGLRRWFAEQMRQSTSAPGR
jgi:Flp pilus assembly protein TadD